MNPASVVSIGARLAQCQLRGAMGARERRADRPVDAYVAQALAEQARLALADG